MERVKRRVRRRLIKLELTDDKFICDTYYGGNKIYEIDAHNSPNTMLELGRLREIAFRDAGGGTGKSVDIDEYDTAEEPFKQLIVWSPKEREIFSSYRYILGEKIKVEDGKLLSPMGKMFHFSQEFLDNYLPYAMELGRSFVQPQYQVANSRKEMFALDNIWDGLGATIFQHPEIKYVYGKMTMYSSYPRLGRDLVLYFLNKHFKPEKMLMEPIVPMKYEHEESLLASVLYEDNFNEDYKILQQEIAKLGTRIPPLVNIYMGLSPKMQCFGTIFDASFGNVEETAILIDINDIYPAKRERYFMRNIQKG